MITLVIVVLMILGSFGAVGLTIKNIDSCGMQDFVPGEVIVGFSDDVDVNNLKVGGIDPVLGCEIVQIIASLNVVVVKVNKGEEDKYVDVYLDSPSVSYAEKNGIVYTIEYPNDPGWSKQWGPRNIKCPEAWASGTGSSNVILAIIDTGIDLDHEDLAGRLWTNTQGYHGKSFVDYGDENIPDDDNGHGTHCAGIAAAMTDNDKGIAGVAGETPVELMAVKVLSSGGSGRSSWVAAGIDYATNNGAHIISMSLGSDSSSTTIEQACFHAWDNDVVVVAAAGNSNTNRRHYPAGYDDYVIAVAAINSNNKRASFSNFGDWVDLAAPGVDIYSTFKGGGYRSFSGTSMACPHVAGVAALGRSKGWSREQIWSVLESSADKEGFDFVGWGKVDATFHGGLNPEPEFEVTVTINRITNVGEYLDEVDYDPPIGDGKPAEWYYEIVVSSGGEEEMIENFDFTDTFVEAMDEVGISYYDHDWVHRKTWTPGSKHTFYTYNGDLTVDIQIILMDNDDVLNDYADISEQENGPGNLYDYLLVSTKPGRIFTVTYDLVINKIIDGDRSDKVGTDEFPRITRGWWDGSTSDEIPIVLEKQDDAELEFEITDTCIPPEPMITYEGIPVVGRSIQFYGDIKSGTGAGEPFIWKWDFDNGGTSNEQNPTHIFNEAKTYTVKLEVTDKAGQTGSVSKDIIITENHKPNAPTITGATEGKGGVEYEYTFKATDDDGDRLYYYIDWGDGDIENWFGVYNSGEEVKVKHTWDETILKKSYTIRAKVKDPNAESNWGTLKVTMPKSKQLINLEKGIYVENVKKISFPIPIIVGSIDIEVDAEGSKQSRVLHR